MLNRIDAIYPEFLNSKLPVLHSACEMGNTDMVRAILQCPPFVDQGDNTLFVHQKLNEMIEGVPPLGHAYENGHLEIAKMLVDHGADSNWLRMVLQEGNRQFKPMLDHPEVLDFFFGTLKGAQVSLDPFLTAFHALSLPDEPYNQWQFILRNNLAWKCLLLQRPRQSLSKRSFRICSRVLLSSHCCGLQHSGIC